LHGFGDRGSPPAAGRPKAGRGPRGGDRAARRRNESVDGASPRSVERRSTRPRQREGARGVRRAGAHLPMRPLKGTFNVVRGLASRPKPESDSVSMILPQVHLRNGEFSCGGGVQRIPPEGGVDYILSLFAETRHHLVCEQHPQNQWRLGCGSFAPKWTREGVVTLPELIGSATLGAPSARRRAWYPTAQ